MYGIIPAIIVIGYNRPSSMARLLDRLNQAEYPVDEVPLIISIDKGSGDGYEKVLEIVDAYVWKHGEKQVFLQEENLGLKEHFLKLGDFSEKYGAAIIFEDDVYPSVCFYSYVLQALDFYKNDERIFAVSLYAQDWNGYAGIPFIPLNNGYDVHISQIECSWGECFIGNQWKLFKQWYEQKKCEALVLNPEVPSQVYKWDRSYSKYLINYIVENEKYYVTPYVSHSTNYAEVGVHEKISDTLLQVPMACGDRRYSFPDFDNSLHYDIYFELKELKKYLAHKMGKKCCVDYAGIRENYDSYDYVLSGKELPYRVIEEYGLVLRPWEVNIYDRVTGNDIYLYDVSAYEKTMSKWKRKYHKVRYQIKSVKWSDAIYYGIKTRINANKK